MITLGVENVALGPCPRATFSTPGSSYFNVTLTTVHNQYNVDELDIGSNKGADILRFVLNDSNSLNQSVLNFSYTAAAPPTPPPFFVRYTNRRFWTSKDVYETSRDPLVVGAFYGRRGPAVHQRKSTPSRP